MSTMTSEGREDTAVVDDAGPYTVDEVAAMLRVGRSSVYDAIKAGELGHFRVGRLIRVSREHVAAFVAGEVGEVAQR
ncbi:MAG: helix-turn-helix domain-containing protein [Actinomycetaceae bacterium]|jgi:excisionase family DNA binding protein